MSDPVDKLPPISTAVTNLFRVKALVLRFVRNLKIKDKMLRGEAVCQGEVTLEEMANAETQWMRSVQTQANNSKLEGDFVLYEDSSGVLRCKERIENADVPHETKRPALLPRNHYILTSPRWSNPSSAEDKGLDCKRETVC